MGTFNECDRILKEDVCLEKLYLKTMDNQNINVFLSDLDDAASFFPSALSILNYVQIYDKPRV